MQHTCLAYQNEAWSAQSSLSHLISYHGLFVCFTVITLAESFLGDMPQDLCTFCHLSCTFLLLPQIFAWLTSSLHLSVSSNAVSPEGPLIPYPLITLCPLIMLHIFHHIVFISFLFFFLECNLNYLKSGTLPFSRCIPRLTSTSSIKEAFDEHLLNEWTQQSIVVRVKYA